MTSPYTFLFFGLCAPRAHLVIPEKQQHVPYRDKFWQGVLAACRRAFYDGYKINTAILYPPLGFEKPKNLVFHIQKTYQRSWFFHIF